MSNKEILKQLKKNSSAKIFAKNIVKWDLTNGKMSSDDAHELVRLDKWQAEDFTFDNELRIAKYLPDWMLDVYFEMKDYKKAPYPFITSQIRAFAKLMSYPCTEDHEKDFCMFEHWYQIYESDPKIKHTYGGL